MTWLHHPYIPSAKSKAQRYSVKNVSILAALTIFQLVKALVKHLLSIRAVVYIGFRYVGNSIV